MRIVEIVAFDNGGHRNQTTHGAMNTVPEGWAVVPEHLDTPNFPFGNLTVDEQTPPVVLTWEPLPIPEPEPVEPEPEDASVWDELDAAYTEGVNSAYDQ